MDSEDVPDSEDDAWLSPWSNSSGPKEVSGISADRYKDETIPHARSASPDELATDFDRPLEKSDRAAPGLLEVASNLQPEQGIEYYSDAPRILLSSAVDDDETTNSAGQQTPVITPTALSESVGTTTRKLRPRTYQQLHTYEYEHAKYVLECRAAGIKPVRFDGSRYREMDKHDEDFVPPEERHRPVHSPISETESRSPGSLPEASTLPSPRASPLAGKRRRHVRPARFKDPRKYDPARLLLETGASGSTNQHHIERDVDVFDFPDEHWQMPMDTSDLHVPDAGNSFEADVSSKSVGDAPIDIAMTEQGSSKSVTSSSEVSDDEDSERARYARKLKGILPPSFLTKNFDKKFKKQISRHQQELPFRHDNTKGIAKKKFSSNPMYSLSMSDDDEGVRREISLDNMTPQSLKSPSSMQKHASIDLSDNDTDIPEFEEGIDRMLPTSTRRKRLHSSSSGRHESTNVRHTSHQAALLTALTDAGPEQAKILRLAHRNLKRKREKQMTPTTLFSSTSGTVTHNNRSVRSHKRSKPTPVAGGTVVRLLKGRLNRASISTQSDRWQGKDISRVRKRRTSLQSYEEHDVYKNALQRGRSEQIFSLRTREHSASSSRSSKTSVSEAASVDATYDDFDVDMRLRRAQETRATINRGPSRMSTTSAKHGSNSPNSVHYKLGTRTFVTEIQHENGHFAKKYRKRKAEKDKPKYLSRFGEIANVFGADEDYLYKVSAWQKTQLKPRQVLSEDKSSDVINKSKQKRVIRKRDPHQRKLVQSTIADAIDSTLLPSTYALPETNDFPESAYFGCSPRADGERLSSRTFVADYGLARILGHHKEGTTRRCFIAGKSLLQGSDMAYALDHGFSHLNSILSKATMQCDALEEDHDCEVYDFLKFAVSSDEIVDLETTLQQLQELHEIGRDHTVPHSRQRRLQYWIFTFLLLVMFKLHLMTDKTSFCIEYVDKQLSLHIRELLLHGHARSPLTRSEQDAGARLHNDVGLYADEALLELWIVLVHISNATDLPFWHRVNQCLDLKSMVDRADAERIWETIFNLAGVCQFDVYGQVSPSSMQNWLAVEVLVEKIAQDYRDDVKPDASQDAYTNLIMRRILALVVQWSWPEVSTLLGHGRSGGVLYGFFFNKLHLRALPHEVGQLPSFPLFMYRPTIVHSLSTVSASITKNTFHILVELIYHSLLQYLTNLKLSTAELERLKRRGLGIVDKLATLGRLNYPATEPIDQSTVHEIQNRYSLEIAVYWAAADWKDRGMQSLIQASIEAMPGCHLVLRKIQIDAWAIVTRIQLDRSEENALDDTMKWLKANVQTTISDLLQFRHQSRLELTNARTQALMNKNAKKCHELLSVVLENYTSILLSSNGATTTKRLYFLWLDDVLRPILQLHETFLATKTSIAILEKAFIVINVLIKKYIEIDNEEDSQDYGQMDLSQDLEPLVDFDLLLAGKCESLLGFLFQFLTNITSQELVTPMLKKLAKMGLKSFTTVILHMRIKGRLSWPELFDDRGAYSWTRLLDRPIKDIMLPYYLAILIEGDASFFPTMQTYILSAWFCAMAQPHVRDSLATMTTVLANTNYCIFLKHLPVTDSYGKRIVTTQLLDQNRLELLLEAIRTLGGNYRRSNTIEQSTFDAAESLIALTEALRSSWQMISAKQPGLRDRYTTFIQQVLIGLHQYCFPLLKSLADGQAQALTWLCNPKNVPQSRADFAPDAFKAFGQDDLHKKGIEIAFIIAARCDLDIVEHKSELSSFLCTALTNTQLDKAVPPVWEPSTARLRNFIVLSLLQSYVFLEQQHAAARLYSSLLAAAMSKVYLTLVEQSWACSRDYIRALHLEIGGMMHRVNLDITLRDTMQGISNHLSRYSYIDTTENAQIPENFDPSNSVTQALSASLKNSWTVTAQGLHHTRRQVTVSLPVAMETMTGSGDVEVSLDTSINEDTALANLYL